MSQTTDVAPAGVPAAPVRLLEVVRTRFFEMVILVWSLLFSVPILTYFQIVRRPSEVRWLLRLWSRGFVFSARHILGVRHRLEGVENIPDGPAIFVVNHQSYWESIAFTAFFPGINVITKSEAMDIPVFGWGLRHAPMIRVDRSRPGGNLRRIVREAHRSLAHGRSVLLFPEGTRVAPGTRRPYLRGLELIYRYCDVPIVPVVHDAGLLWSVGFQVKHAGEVTLRFLEPVRPGQPASAIAAQLEDMLNTEKDKLLGLRSEDLS